MQKRMTIVMSLALLCALIGGRSIAQEKGSGGTDDLAGLRNAIAGSNDAAFDETVSFRSPSENSYANLASRGAGFFAVDAVADAAGVDYIVNPAYASKTHGDLAIKVSVKGNCLQQHPGGYFKLFFSPDNVCGKSHYWRIPNKCFVSATKIGECSDGCWIWEVRIRC